MRRVLLLVVALLLVACASAPAGASEPVTRYPVISDMLSLERRVEALEGELREARDQIGVLTLLREHDVARARSEWLIARAQRSDDLKRLYALELAADRDEGACAR